MTLAAASTVAEQLESVGLRPICPDESCPGVVNCFERLPYVGAYVIQTSSKKIAEKARTILELDHLIAGDVTLGFTHPVSASIVRRTRGPTMLWPESSGIQLARERGVNGKGVLVGVLDSGCDADHREFRQRTIDFCYVPINPVNDAIRKVRGFDVNGHGTHVAGIVAGANVGIAPAVDLMAAAVIESETVKTTLDRVLVGLDWMLGHFQDEKWLAMPTIINMSIGLPQATMNAPDYQQAEQVMRKVLTALVEDFDVLPIAAIGNGGPGHLSAPGYYPECLSVGAVDHAMTPAPFSGGGLSPITGETEPDIAGIGVDVLSGWERTPANRSKYLQKSGTSMAAPYVTGVAALCAAAEPSCQGSNLRRHLLENALPLLAPPDRVGAGLARFV
jgi:subtilisin family serine protease